MNKNKSHILKTTLIGFLAVSTISLAGCRRDESGRIDKSKFQLYIYHYQGGMGNKWLYNNISKYEQLHANDKYGDKTGVQIMITESSNRPTAAGVKNEDYPLYFFEELDFNTFYLADSLEDITGIVKNNPYEPSKSIASKLTDAQKDYFGVGEGDNKKFYALPYYSCAMGITYNKVVFDEKGYYFNDNYENVDDLDSKFVSGLFPNKSVGPNGIPGDYDDGLPVTYDDFYDLCNYIKSTGNAVPFTCYEKNDQDYTTNLLGGLASTHEGAAYYNVNFSMNGDIKVAKMSGKGVDLNPDGTVKTEMVNVNSTDYNGYEVQRSYGKYYALTFMRKLVDEWNNWSASVINNNNSQFDVQNLFIDSQFGLNAATNWQKGKPVAMLLDGNWWYSEASNHINGLSDRQKSQLDYGWMPLPKANKTDGASGLTYLDQGGTMAFVNKSRPALEKQVAADFLAFTCTDESLNDFTKCTNALMAYDYELTDETKESLSSFGRSSFNVYSLSDKIFPVSKNEQFSSKLAPTILSRRWSIADNTTWPISTFKNTDGYVTASSYAYQMYTHYKNIWNN